LRRAFVRVAPATIALGVLASSTREASANPPPPKALPDPPLVGPTRAEAPSVVRRHAGICFAFYPSGGTLAVECPKELLSEPVGEALVRLTNGRCQFTPLTQDSPGRTDVLDKCPVPPFDRVAEQGKIPDWSKKLAVEHGAPPADDEPLPMPMPARLGEAPPQEVGCAIAAPRPSSLAAPSALGIAIGLLARRRKRSAK
jgi:hypothetical protein